jgi:hypothetical protein
MGEEVGGKGLQLLTNSRRAAFNDCPRKHYYMYELNRRPAKTSEALRFGSLVHRMLEHHWLGGEGPINLDEAGCDSDTYEMVRAATLMDGYVLRYAGDNSLKTVVVEQEYRAPLINPMTMKESRTWVLAGKIDAIAQDCTGRYIIVEHKTTSRPIAPDSDYWPRLTIDGQIGGYNVGAEALGYKVDHCLYDVLRKPGQLPLKATPEESRKYTKDGSLYANQRMEDETPEAYHDRVIAAINESPDSYYARRVIVRLQDEITDYMADMWTTGMMIRYCQLNNYWPRSSKACDQYGTCPYFSVCTKCASIDDDSLFVTTAPNPELSTNNK